MSRSYVKTLQYYMRLLAKEQGINWDSDNDAEIEYVIDGIVDEAVDKAVERIEDRIQEGYCSD